MTLVDTGPLVAAANRRDTHHAASVTALTTARPPRLVPGLVIAEVSYLLARDATAAVEAELLRSFATGFLALANLTVADRDRSAELVEQYADLPLGATDACLVALAERLGVVELATWIAGTSVWSGLVTSRGSTLSHSDLHLDLPSTVVSDFLDEDELPELPTTNE